MKAVIEFDLDNETEREQYQLIIGLLGLVEVQLVDEDPTGPVDEPIVEDPDEPTILDDWMTPLVLEGKIEEGFYNWSWNHNTSQEGDNLRVDLASFGGFRVHMPMDTDTGEMRFLHVTMAAKEPQELLVQFAETEEARAKAVSVDVDREWRHFVVPIIGYDNPLDVCISGRSAQETELYINEMWLSSTGELFLEIPADIDFDTDPVIDIEEPVDPVDPVISDSITPRLHTFGSMIRLPDGTPWQGRGVNIFDTRSCNACAYTPPRPDEVIRRVQFASTEMGCNFYRLCLESYGQPGGRAHYQNALADADYLEDTLDIVEAIGNIPNSYVLVSIWQDPTLDSAGVPTQATASLWRTMAEAMSDMPHVMFGVCNEPRMNYSGVHDDLVIDRMQMVYDAIREVAPDTIVAVQGVGGWARIMQPYLTRPIIGTNVVYECHPYNAFVADQWYNVAQQLPVILGEIGPILPGDPMYASAPTTYEDVEAQIQHANELGVSWAGWCLHQRCPPNMLVENGPHCGTGMTLELTDWGQRTKQLIDS